MSAVENKDDMVRMRQTVAVKTNEDASVFPVKEPAKEQDGQMSSSAQAYEHFGKALHLKDAFDSVAVQGNNIGELTTPKPSVEKSPERPVITTAKISAAAAAFS